MNRILRSCFASRSGTRRSIGALVAAVLLAASWVTPAAAATTTLTNPATFSGDRTLSSTGLSASGLGVTATTDLVTTLHWTQAASLNTTFDSNLVRQGRSLDPSDTYAHSVGGVMSVTWTLANSSVSWDGIGPIGLGSPSFSASGPCDLLASGPDYVCHLASSQASLLDTFPIPGPFVKLGLAVDVTVTPQGIATMRQATFGGNPDGTANLTLAEAPITDALAIPCTVGAGDELLYTLGAQSSTPGITAVTSLVFDVGLESPTPVTIAPEIDISFASPSIAIDSTSSSITMTDPASTFDLGAVVHNNIPPTVSAGGPYSGDEGQPIVFNGTGSSSVCGFPTLRWDFSDGGVAFGPTPSHTFPGSGSYSGQLTATDATGLVSTTTFDVTIANLPPVVHAGPDTTSPWGVRVAFNGSATDPGSADQPTLTYSWDFGDGSPSASGGASATHAYAVPGDYTAVLTSCDQFGACASASRVVHVVKRDTTTAYLGDTAGVFDTPATLGASLVDQFGAPVNGRTITFAVGTDGPFTALTNSSGIAVKSYTPTLAAGSYTGSAMFAGDSLYNPSNSANAFVVAKKATTTTYTGATSGGPNKTVVLSAVLTDGTNKPLANRTVTFQLGSQTVAATTNTNGVAAASLKLTQKNGTYTVAATFLPAGSDATTYLGSSQAVIFKLQAK